MNKYKIILVLVFLFPSIAQGVEYQKDSDWKYIINSEHVELYNYWEEITISVRELETTAKYLINNWTNSEKNKYSQIISLKNRIEWLSNEKLEILADRVEAIWYERMNKFFLTKYFIEKLSYVLHERLLQEWFFYVELPSDEEALNILEELYDSTVDDSWSDEEALKILTELNDSINENDIVIHPDNQEVFDERQKISDLIDDYANTISGQEKIDFDEYVEKWFEIIYNDFERFETEYTYQSQRMIDSTLSQDEIDDAYWIYYILIAIAHNYMILNDLYKESNL